MGFFIDPIKITVTNFLEVKVTGGVIVSWDGVDPSVLSVREVASALCFNATYLFSELMLHAENEPALQQLLPQAEPFIKQHKQEFESRLPVEVVDDDEPEDSSMPVHDVWARLSTLRELGAPFLDWKIDFSQISGVVARLSMSKAAWDQCRASQSTMGMRSKADVARYQKALEALLPLVGQLEKSVANADKVAKAFREGSGKPALTALALLAATHEMASVYAQQDAKAERITARTRELLEKVGNEVEKDAAKALDASVRQIEVFYESADFCNKLYDYWDAWDPSLVYYFHAVAERSPDKKAFIGFDTRLGKVLTRACELLNQRIAHSKGAAKEFQLAVAETWKKAVDEPAALKSADARRKLGREVLEKVFKQEKPGWLAVFAVWSGLAMTYTGNMEGPPTIASMLLSTYSRSTHFVEAMRGNDGLLRIIVMWGVDATERDAILTLLKQDKDAQKLARKLFDNGSWRSPAVFAVFYVFSAAMLIHHVNLLVEEFESGKSSGDFDDEVLKLTLPIVQDLMGFLLIGFTQFYSKQMGAYLTTNGVQRLDELAAQIDKLEAGTFAAKGARVVHASLSTVSLILAIWTFFDEKPTADIVEKWLLGLTAGSALFSLVGVVVTRWAFLGPWGVVAGILLGLITVAYQKWFKSTMGAAMQAVAKTLLNDPYLRSKGAKVIGKDTSFVIFALDVTLKELLKETVDALIAFSWQNKLNEKHLVDYSRSGLPAAMIAQLYGLEVDEVNKRLKEARGKARRRKLAAVPTDVTLVLPTTLLVKFKVGEVNEIKLAVTHSDRDQLPNNTWLEPVFGAEDPDVILADGGKTPATTYSPEKGVVMLFTKSSTRFGRIYGGSFRLNKLPPEGKARFFAFVPDDKFATGPDGGVGALIAKEIVFDVEP